MKTINPVLKLTYPIVCLALLAAGVGVFWQGAGPAYPFTTLRGERVEMYGHGLYRHDTVSYAVQGIGQDVVTLLFGIPLLIGGILLARKGSLRGQLLLTGSLGYILYTYASYTFMAAYNELFLVYVALFSLSFFAFILALTGIDREQVRYRVSGKLPRRGIAIFLLFIAAFLTLAWLERIIPPLLTGGVPFGLEANTTLIIQALDLGIVIPVSILAAVLLWRKQAWGYTLASIVMIKGLLLSLAIVGMIVGEMLAGVALSPVEALVFPGIALVAAFFTAILFGNIDERLPAQTGVPLP